MKVYISKYRNHWLSPYTVLEKVLFWLDWENIDYDTPWVEKWSNRLLPICTRIHKFLDLIHPRIEYVKIDRHDTWSMDNTLALIVLPMLKQLKQDKHGAPNVDDDDVPEELKSTSAQPKENEYDVDSNHFLRWDWVLDQMIFAFENKNNNWESQFNSGECDWNMIPVDEDGNEVPKGENKYFMMKAGPNHTHKTDWDARNAYQQRISNGFRLFGKYYEDLWD